MDTNAYYKRKRDDRPFSVYDSASTNDFSKLQSAKSKSGVNMKDSKTVADHVYKHIDDVLINMNSNAKVLNYSPLENPEGHWQFSICGLSGANGSMIMDGIKTSLGERYVHQISRESGGSAIDRWIMCVNVELFRRETKEVSSNVANLLSKSGSKSGGSDADYDETEVKTRVANAGRARKSRESELSHKVIRTVCVIVAFAIFLFLMKWFGLFEVK